MKKKTVRNGVSLVQPNYITSARQEYNEAQENILTLMISRLQTYMTREEDNIGTDLYGHPLIRLDLRELTETNKRYYLASSREMTKKTFEFDYINKDTGLKENVFGVLVTTVRDIKDTPYIELTINPWAIPYLLYWGKGVGGTIFSKSIALLLRGEHTKRLYKLCKRWENQGGFSMSLNDFRKIMCLENKYKALKDLRRRVLDSSIKKMKEDADVYFKYSLEKIGGSRAYNQINFSVYPNQKNIPKKEVKTEMYSFIYNILVIAYPREKSSKAMNICDKVAQDPDEFERLYRRLKKIKRDLDTGTKDITNTIRLIKHVMKEDYGVS